MQAYEFYAKPENGVIPIPEQYRDKITGDVMVIVWEKNLQNLTQRKITLEKLIYYRHPH